MSRSHARACRAALLSFWSLIALIASARLDAEIIRLGNEFQVNSYTTFIQTMPAVAVGAVGDFVVVWSTNGKDGSSYGVFARRFDSVGVPKSVEFQVNSYTTGGQTAPAVAIDGAGKFVIAWSSHGQDGNLYGVFARRFGSGGGALASEFQVNAYTSGAQQLAAVAVRASGEFVIAWEGAGLQDGSGVGIFARRFDAAGSPQAAEFQVNTFTSANQRSPALAMGSGDFVVAWHSNLQDGSLYGVIARRFDSAGSPLAVEFQVNTYTTGDQARPAVAIDAAGNFVIVWDSYEQDGGNEGVFGRRFNSAGTPQALEFQVNKYTATFQGFSRVAFAAGGDFIVAWASGYNQDGSYYGVFGRRFNSAGAPQGGEFQINSYTEFDQTRPALASDGGGHVVVAWRSLQQDGDSTGIFAQRLTTLAVLDVDGNGSTGALTDGLLVLRFLFGFTGPTLTAGAVGSGCTRCDGATIGAYLQTLI